MSEGVTVEEVNQRGNGGPAEEWNEEQDDVPRPLELSSSASMTLLGGPIPRISSEEIPWQPGRSASGGSTLFRPSLQTTGQIWLDQSEVRG